MSEAHQLAVSRFDLLDVAGHAFLGADLVEHAQHFFVRAAVQRSGKRRDGRCRGGVRDRRTELPTARMVLVLQFCSWSACRMNSTSSACASTGLALNLGSVRRHSMFMKFLV